MASASVCFGEACITGLASLHDMECWQTGSPALQGTVPGKQGQG